MITDYYYLHKNGDLIHKPASVLNFDPGYFDSPFVLAHWGLDIHDRLTAYVFLIDADAMGAKKERIAELRSKWYMDECDLDEFLRASRFVVDREGDQWCAHGPDFINLMESNVGFGPTRWDALVELCKDVKKRNLTT